MTIITNGRKILIAGFAFFGLVTALLATAAPGHAQTYRCHWSPRGTICNMQ